MTRAKTTFATVRYRPGTHHFLILEVDLHPAAERLVFTGYGHVGNSLVEIIKKLSRIFLASGNTAFVFSKSSFQKRKS